MIGSVQIECASTGRRGTKGCIKGKVISLATVNNLLIQAAAAVGQPVVLAELVVINASAALKYLHLYDKATTPVAGSDVPVWTIPLAPTGGGVALTSVNGLGEYTLGLGISITGGMADTDATAVAANDVVMNYILRT